MRNKISGARQISKATARAKSTVFLNGRYQWFETLARKMAQTASGRSLGWVRVGMGRDFIDRLESAGGLTNVFAELLRHRCHGADGLEAYRDDLDGQRAGSRVARPS
jgi:hypothetical protein